MSHCLDENTALELIEGKLSSAARTTIERHLEGCDACRELASELAKSEDDAPVASVAEASVGPTPETTRAPATLARGARAGPYRVEEPIGSGSAGTVYRAIDERTNQVVALKLVTDPALRTRFAREAATLARLDHDAIVRYVGHGENADGMYLAMEWLEGEDLEQRFQRGALGWEGARAIGLRVSAALAHAHALGCVHRDISPRNVFLPEGRLERAKLLDFGLVRVEGNELARTATNAVLGTPFYMSPEQIRDPKRVTDRSDLFGLGVLLFEAISGTRPFEGDDLFTVWIKIVDQPAPNLRTLAAVPEPLALLVEALLCKDPASRPSSAREVNDRLLALSAIPPSATAVMAPIRPQYGAPPAPRPSAPVQVYPPPHASVQLAPTAPDMRPIAPRSAWPAVTSPPTYLPPEPARAPTPGWRAAFIVAAAFLGVAIAGGVGAYVHSRATEPTIKQIRITSGDDDEDEPAKPKPPQRFPLPCVDGEELHVSGDWEGPGPAITSVSTNCKIFVSNAKIKASTLFKSDATGVELSLENVVLETTDVAASGGTNFTVRMRETQIYAAGDGLVGELNFAIPTMIASKVESKGGAALRSKHGITVRAENGTIVGKTGAVAAAGAVDLKLSRASTVTSSEGIAVESATATIKAEGGTIAGSRGIKTSGSIDLDAQGLTLLATSGSAIAGGSNVKVSLVASTVRSPTAAIVVEHAEISLTGGRLEGGTTLVSGANGLQVVAKQKAVLSGAQAGIVGTSNLEVELDDATLEAGTIAVRSQVNAKVKLTSGARLAGKTGAIATEANLRVEGEGSTIDGGTGAGIAGTTGAHLRIASGVIRGVPAVSLSGRPQAIDLGAARLEGGQRIAR